jgi:hypothetical protein
MGKTPDRFPGQREEDEGVRLDPGTEHPTQNGELRYVDGVGFRFFENGVEVGLAGSGITEGQHEGLDTLVHEIDETSFDEVIYTASFITQYIVWASPAKLLKIREEQYTYSAGMVSQVVTIQYDGTGAVQMTMTEQYTYSGSRITSVTRTKS